MRPSAQIDTHDSGLLPSCTLVLWSTCLAVGIMGPLWSSIPPSTSKIRPVELVAEVLRIDPIQPVTQPGPVSKSVVPPSAPAQALPQPAPPPAPVAAVIPAAPEWMALREPTPSKAPSQFAVPIQSAVQEVSQPTGTGETQTNGSASAASSANNPVGGQGSGDGVPQTLVFGQGDGNQPAPRYPARAKAAGQQGTVLVQFSVGENGRVLTAEITQSSPWTLLNEEALRTVRDRYRFKPGRFRLYQIAIRFELGR